MKRLLSVPVLLVAALAGCTAVLGRGESESERRLAAGLAAFDDGNYPAAFENLSWLTIRYPNEPVGQRALLALASADLDPRNPSRRLGVGSELVARYLREPATPDWLRPTAEVLYLLAQELGAAEERIAAVEEDRRRAEARSEAVPTYAGQSVPQRMRALTEERDRLNRRVAQLEQELARTNQELERIRKTLRP